MNAARVLRWARRHALLSQRELAEKAGVPQSTVARIEAGRVDPRVGLLSRLLRACEYDLEVLPLLGQGVDRTHIRAQLRLTPAERLAQVTPMVRSMAGWHGILRRPATGRATQRPDHARPQDDNEELDRETQAGGRASGGVVHVRSYRRADGSEVPEHWRRVRGKAAPIEQPDASGG